MKSRKYIFWTKVIPGLCFGFYLTSVWLDSMGLIAMPAALSHWMVFPIASVLLALSLLI